MFSGQLNNDQPLQEMESKKRKKEKNNSYRWLSKHMLVDDETGKKPKQFNSHLKLIKRETYARRKHLNRQDTPHQRHKKYNSDEILFFKKSTGKIIDDKNQNELITLYLADEYNDIILIPQASRDKLKEKPIHKQKKIKFSEKDTQWLRRHELVDIKTGKRPTNLNDEQLILVTKRLAKEIPDRKVVSQYEEFKIGSVLFFDKCQNILIEQDKQELYQNYLNDQSILLISQATFKAMQSKGMISAQHVEADKNSIETNDSGPIFQEKLSNQDPSENLIFTEKENDIIIKEMRKMEMNPWLSFFPPENNPPESPQIFYNTKDKSPSQK